MGKFQRCFKIRHHQADRRVQDVFDYKPFETWDEEGGRDTQTLAALRVEQLLGAYRQPDLDPAIAEALSAYIAEKKASMPDAFM